MRTKGLEPSHLAVLEPKSSASANSATSAYSIYYYSKNPSEYAKVGDRTRWHRWDHAIASHTDGNYAKASSDKIK